MIGVLISSRKEFKILLDVYNITDDYLENYPYGKYYRTNFMNKDIVFYTSGARKINSAAATQYMIDRFALEKVIVIGTCTSITDGLDYNDVVIPARLVDYDSIIRQLTSDIDENSYIYQEDINISLPYYDITLGSSDKALVLWKDLTYLASIGIDASDMESYSVCKVCSVNNINFLVIKGVTDRPMKSDLEYSEQVSVYEENYPIVIRKIIEDYLPEVI